LGLGLSEEETFDSTVREKNQILEDEALGVESTGLRIVGLEKVYRKYPFGIKSPKDVHAV
jgi:hypothetical protein